MSKPVRISDELYSRLESLTEGFETPSDTILRIVNEYEYLKSYEIINRILTIKTEILTEENLKETEASILMHYDPLVVKQAATDIIKLYSTFKITFKNDAMGITLRITKL